VLCAVLGLHRSSQSHRCGCLTERCVRSASTFSRWRYKERPACTQPVCPQPSIGQSNRLASSAQPGHSAPQLCPAAYLYRRIITKIINVTGIGAQPHGAGSSVPVNIGKISTQTLRLAYLSVLEVHQAPVMAGLGDGVAAPETVRGCLSNQRLVKIHMVQVKMAASTVECSDQGVYALAAPETTCPVRIKTSPVRISGS